MFKYLFLSLSLFFSFSLAYADDSVIHDGPFAPVNPTKPNGLPNMYYPDLRTPFERRMERINSLSNKMQILSAEVKEIRKLYPGTGEVMIGNKYPIVPYDPNHPNVLKEEEKAREKEKEEKRKERRAKFTVSAKTKTLAGRFARGLNSAAMAYAVIAMIGDGVDWLLDTENHRIVFNKPLDGYLFKGHISQVESTVFEHVAEAECQLYGGVGDDIYDIEGKIGVNSFIYVPCEDGRATVWVHETQTDTLTLEEIAEYVIRHENKKTDTTTNNNTTNNTTNNVTNIYHGAVSDTIAEQISKGEHDDAIREALKRLEDDEPSKTTDAKEETTGAFGEETTGSSGSGSVFNFPDFCGWANSVCDWLDWTQEELDLEPEEVPETEIKLKNAEDFDKPHLNIGGSCPADIVRSFNTGFATNEIRFEMQPICNHASTYIRPIVIFIAYIWSVIYIGGAFRVS